MYKQGSRVMRLLRLANLLLGLACFFASAPQASATPSEEDLRAAVIVAILRFTSWSTIIDEARLQVCLVGQPLSGRPLLAAAGQQKIAARTLYVKRARKSLESCQVVVVGGDIGDIEFEQLLAEADSHSALTVCDGCRRGLGEDTIIQLKLRQQRVSFEVNLARAKSNGITLDAQLLELAAVVRK